MNIFIIEKQTLIRVLFIGPGTAIMDTNGRIATPKWLPNCEVTILEDFYWIIMPQVGEELNSISITFNQVQNGNPALDCSTPSSNNAITFRAGTDYQSPPVGQFCLNELPENFIIPSTVGRIDFLTVDSSRYGFLADFELGKTRFSHFDIFNTKQSTNVPCRGWGI